MLGTKAGDNTQVRALADELGYGYEEKQIRARPWELLVHFGCGATLAGIDRGASSALGAPWPDLVISAGRRNEAVARWIKQQSGGKAALVHMGRPWADLDEWDLVVTTPQYFLPQRHNVLHNSLPLHRLGREQLEEAGAALRPQLAGLPRPWIVLLVGGDSGRFVLTTEKGARLGALASELAAACGGSLLVTDSPRTPVQAADALQSRLTVPHYCYRWGGEGVNPYRGLLALADAFVVTGESMSMLGEASAMGRPLFIFDVGDGSRAWWRLVHSYRYKPLSHRIAMHLGPLRMRREIGNIQAALVAGGLARWLEPGTIAAASAELLAPAQADELAGSLAARELAATATAVRRLLTGC
ncbi:MAG: mitochondrial fission ELM1 family protein [Halioglobus sp.]|nr:mitochondrial fission ELM1 family protein [Halioglobus sp.]